MHVLKVRTACASAPHPWLYAWNRTWLRGALMFERISGKIQGTASVDKEAGGFGPSEGFR